MLKFFNFITRSKNSVRTKKGNKNSLEDSSFIGLIGKSLPDLGFDVQKKLKRKIFRKIAPSLLIENRAKLLDRKISGKEKIKMPAELLDWLVVIASSLYNLPKVVPRVAWRERVRSRFISLRVPFWKTLRQSATFAVLFVMVMGIVFTFVSPADPVFAEVARLSVEKGVAHQRSVGEESFSIVVGEASVRLGDTIRLELDSSARLSFLDKSEIELTSETELSIIEFQQYENETEKNKVKVNVVSGSVLVNATSAFEIETPTGSIEANKAEFSVEINQESGAAIVQANKETVAIKSLNDGQEMFALEAGQTATMSSSQVLLAETVVQPQNLELPKIEELLTKIDIIQIRSFDTLIIAQSGEVNIAQKNQALLREELKGILSSLTLTEVEINSMEALELLLRENYLESPQLSEIFSYLTKIKRVESILNYYLAGTELLRGLPEFELLPSNYRPPTRFRNIFAVLRVRQLAYEEARSFAKELTSILINDLIASIQAGNNQELLKEIQEGMNEPIYLSSLEKIQESVPLLDEQLSQLINKLKKEIEAYKGA